jgi:hypothetical protein
MWIRNVHLTPLLPTFNAHCQGCGDFYSIWPTGPACSANAFLITHRGALFSLYRIGCECAEPSRVLGFRRNNAIFPEFAEINSAHSGAGHTIFFAEFCPHSCAVFDEICTKQRAEKNYIVGIAVDSGHQGHRPRSLQFLLCGSRSQPMRLRWATISTSRSKPDRLDGEKKPSSALCACVPSTNALLAA